MSYAGPLEALDRVLNRGGDADDVLRAVVEIVAGPFAWAGILFREDGRLVLGPQAGEPDESRADERCRSPSATTRSRSSRSTATSTRPDARSSSGSRC